MDIAPADRSKKIIRFALWYARKKLAEGKTKDEISYDMQHCGNPIIRRIYNKINEGLDEIKEEPQRNRTKEVAEFFLWILNKDTAYRQPFFYILNEMLKDKEMFKGIEKYVTEPDKWYVNQWHESKEVTKKKREDGKITDRELSPAELIYVPNEQNRKFRQIYDEMEKERRKWW